MRKLKTNAFTYCATSMPQVATHAKSRAMEGQRTPIPTTRIFVTTRCDFERVPADATYQAISCFF